MKVREINLLKRFKNEENEDLEYLILKGDELVNISSDLNNLANNISKIFKKYGINKIVYNQNIPENMNEGYLYKPLNRDETKRLDKYMDKTDMFR